MFVPDPLVPEEAHIVTAAYAFIKAYQPDFVEYVKQVQQEAKPATIIIEGFSHEDTREQVQACLWYALGNNVPVTIRWEQSLPDKCPPQP